MTSQTDSSKDVKNEIDYWNNFYDRWVTHIPSQFCVQMLTEIDRGQTVVEYGSGNGRDTCFMAMQGHPIVAMDLSGEAIEKATELLKTRGVEHAKMTVGDVSSEPDVLAALTRARGMQKAASGSLVVYSRFLLHSLDDSQQHALMSALGANLNSGDRLFLEFRSLEDESTEKIFGNHYRRFVDSVALENDLRSQHGFTTEYFHTGQGMAKYKDEDPFVTRIIARKN